jgi:signal transduction histidine kinase
MNAIMGFSELIQNEFDEPKAKKFTNQILINSQYLQNLINDIVDISIIEAGQINIKRSTFVLKNLFNELKPVIEALPYWKNRDSVELFYPDCELLEDSIYCDPSKLKQVLVNLISNSVKYTPSGWIKMSVYQRSNEIEFCISDTGAGIPLSEQEKIFDRFSKIARRVGPTVHGIGLGLSICKAIVEALGGRIWFKSTECKGTAFFFTIPMN